MSDEFLCKETFVVFRLEDVLAGIPAEAVDSIVTAQAACDSTGAFVALRSVILRSRQGLTPPPIRASGALQVVSLPRSQVVPLPRMCATARCAVTGIALFEEKVQFVIVDPYRLAEALSCKEMPADAQELR